MRTMLIENGKFLAAQLRQDTVPDVVRIMAVTHDVRAAYYDADGNVTSALATDPAQDSVRVLEGEFIYTDYTYLRTANSVDEVFSAYEEIAGPLPDGSAEEKMVDIEFKEFVTDLDYDPIQWEWVQFPFNQTREDFLERARHGVSNTDWWNFDTYFATVMVNFAKKIKEGGHTAPYTTGDLDEDSRLWDGQLDRIIAAFSNYLESDEEGVPYDKELLDEAFDIIKQRYRSMWD